MISHFAPLATCLVVLLCGCGAGSEKLPLAKVSGTVTLDGQPISSGTIQFEPDESQGTVGRMAVGGIQKDGTFELTTYEVGDGALVGHHLVGIQSFQMQPSKKSSPGPTEASPQSSLPSRYMEAARSGLTATVVQGKKNVINFELTTTP